MTFPLRSPLPDQSHRLVPRDAPDWPAAVDICLAARGTPACAAALDGRAGGHGMKLLAEAGE